MRVLRRERAAREREKRAQFTALGPDSISANDNAAAAAAAVAAVAAAQIAPPENKKPGATEPPKSKSDPTAPSTLPAAQPPAASQVRLP